MTAFTPDERLPYTVTSSIEFGTESIRVLRCTAKGHIASGAETFNAPVLDLSITRFADEHIVATTIITPDAATAEAIAVISSASPVSLENFADLVRKTATELKADERAIKPVIPREPTDAASSAYTTAQQLYSLLSRQMPRVQAALVTPAAAK